MNNPGCVATCLSQTLKYDGGQLELTSNMSTPLERVQHLLVTPDNPPRNAEGLDTERCAELHNAILEHGWLSSGRSAEDFQSQCTPFYERAAEEIDEKCTPSLEAFF